MSPWDELGDGIFRRRYETLDQNIGLIAGSDEAIVIDTRSHHVHADELRRDVARLTKVPVTTVINTHMHWDHAFGNARFPGCRIIGHVTCRSRLIEDGEKMRNATIAQLPEEWHEPLRGVEIVPPDTTFENSMTIDLDDRQIRLAHFGRGHTDNDIAVMIDDILFAGDLIEQGAPPAFGDSYPKEWPSTLGQLLKEAAPVWVPGHGDVVDRPFVENQRDELAQVARLIEQRMKDNAESFRAGPYSAAVLEQAWERRTAT
jgi:glyoxylase-like metal-dependent hydrolase (beta-lactamase superfamily II)